MCTSCTQSTPMPSGEWPDRFLAVSRWAPLPFFRPHPASKRRNRGNVTSLILVRQQGIHLTEPLGFNELAAAIEGSHLVITDSGGLQEECTVYQRPVLILRDSTERPEGVQAGVARLVGANTSLLHSTCMDLLQDTHPGGLWSNMSRATWPYGWGNASRAIMQHLLRMAPSLARGDHRVPGRFTRE